MTWALIVCYTLTFFIPEWLSISIGSLNMTPNLALAIVLFPVLLFDGRIRWAWPDAMVMVLFLIFLYTFAISTDLFRAIEGWGRMFLLGAVPYMLGRYVTQNLIRMRAFLTFLITGMAICSIFLILESLNGFNIHSAIWHVASWEYPEKRLGLIRARGFTTHPIMNGLVYVSFIPLVLIVWKEKIGVVGKYPLLKLAGLFVGVFLSLSSGAWIPAMLGVGLVFYEYFFRIGAGARWLIVWVGAPTLYYLMEIVANRPVLRVLMMELHLSSHDAWYYRWMLYQRVYGVMPGHWLTGHGLNTPMEFVGTWNASIDNQYLVVLLKHGQVGLVAWIAMMALVILYGGRAVWGNGDGPLVRLSRGVMLAIPMIGLAQLTVALFSQATLIYWLAMGMSVGMAQACKQAMMTAAKTKRQARMAQPAQPQPAMKASA